MGHPPVLTSPNRISMLLQRFACARLSRPCLPESCPGVSATLTTTAFDRSSLRWLGISSRSPNPKGPPSSLVQLRMPFGPAMLVTQDPIATIFLFLVSSDGDGALLGE